ncbi:hypothetical protein [Cohaesibacter sp. CAU 1516]|uniref:hypothetical protein n=1 Tax=Cohaesibacter sp. CAU 1516 TaxID=2576038 RepID=UPI0010FD4933|nr:hypothetical protein [Cohaesibacter sp. CAU 1516]
MTLSFQTLTHVMVQAIEKLAARRNTLVAPQSVIQVYHKIKGQNEIQKASHVTPTTASYDLMFSVDFYGAPWG